MRIWTESHNINQFFGEYFTGHYKLRVLRSPVHYDGPIILQDTVQTKLPIRGPFGSIMSVVLTKTVRFVRI
jgi:hypothetical protein